MYKDAPVTIIVLIRTEDARKQIGDYFATQLESIGFTADRQYKTRSEASPIWVQSDPAEGKFSVYTGGWINTAISRDQGSDFSFYYTPRDYPIPLFQAYKPSAEFDAVALRLRNNDFKSMDERAELFKTALRLSLQDSVRIWCNDQTSFSPFNANVSVAYDLAAGIAGSSLYPYTIRFKDQTGGVIRIAQPGILVDAWNPIAGSNWIYDSMPQRATLENATVYDPYTGLVWPQRLEKAEITVKEGLPVAKTLDWVTLNTAASIDVPGDAWADWDPVNQKFITASEAYTQPQTAMMKSVVYYPADLWTTVKWHDGSPISMGDFVMGMIMTFERGKKDSTIYDAAAAENLAAFQAHFKAVKIVSTDPLVIETYDDLYYLDAEINVYSWWPTYTYGPGAWHNIAIGIQAEKAGTLAFSADKADEKKIEWMNYVSGPSLPFLKLELDTAAAKNFIPFAPTMGQYVKADEATLRYANLSHWYKATGHFWIGTGPYYLDKVFPVEGFVTLGRAYSPDPSEKWSKFGAPKLAVAEVSGPPEVTSGTEATFDVLITFEGAPYANADLAEVKYLLFDATGALSTSGVATAMEDGHFQVVLPADVTTALAAGSNKLVIAVTSKVVSIPSFASFEFVTLAP
jgi:peptide/nickel transport system substrate-binding protein